MGRRNAKTAERDAEGTRLRKILALQIAAKNLVFGKRLDNADTDRGALADIVVGPHAEQVKTRITALQRLLAGTNITVNGVRPGEIATPMNDEAPEDALDTDRPHIPNHRPGHPTEIASMVRYLARTRASTSTGRASTWTAA